MFALPHDAADNSVAASGLPRQVDGVVSGDRRSPVLQHMGHDKRAWQVPKDRPVKPILLSELACTPVVICMTTLHLPHKSLRK